MSTKIRWGCLLSLAPWCVLACGPENQESTEAASTSGADETGSGTSSMDTTGGVPTTGDPAAWPLCEPWQLDHFGFVVGTGQWPDGHHTATCSFAALAVEQMLVQGTMWWQHTLKLEGCTDAHDQPTSTSMDLHLASKEKLAVPLTAGQGVAVRLWFERGSQLEVVQWYALRDAVTDEPLLAAFADPGPTIAPKLGGEPPLDGWLAPFTAELGEFVCPVEVGPYCEGDDSPRRALVHFVRNGSSIDVVGGTVGDLGDHRVHLGFAGTPDFCEGIAEHPSMYGVLVRKP